MKRERKVIWNAIIADGIINPNKQGRIFVGNYRFTRTNFQTFHGVSDIKSLPNLDISIHGIDKQSNLITLTVDECLFEISDIATDIEKLRFEIMINYGVDIGEINEKIEWMSYDELVKRFFNELTK